MMNALKYFYTWFSASLPHLECMRTISGRKKGFLAGESGEVGG